MEYMKKTNNLQQASNKNFANKNVIKICKPQMSFYIYDMMVFLIYIFIPQ